MGWKWRAYFGLVVLVEVGLLSGAAWARWRPAPQPPDWSVELSQRARADGPLAAPPIPISNDHVRRDERVDLLMEKVRLSTPGQYPQELADYGKPRR